MEIVRPAEPRPAPPLRPVAAALAVLLNGGLLVIIALTRHAVPMADTPEAAIEVTLVEPEPPGRPEPEETPGPKSETQPTPESAPETAPAAPRPGRLPQAPEDESAAEPALRSFACALLPDKLRDLRPDCRQEGDPFAARIGRVTAGMGEADVPDRPLGDLLGGRFAGKDRYQIEVMLGLRSTSLGTKYHVPVDHGPPDEPTDLSGSDGTFGTSPIPDG